MRSLTDIAAASVASAHLKHLGHHGIRPFADIYTHCFSIECLYPPLEMHDYNSPTATWQTPHPSPAAGSHRPISILCTSSKKIIFSEVLFFLLCSFQYISKSLHSSTTLLTALSQSILERLNIGKPAPRFIIVDIYIAEAIYSADRGGNWWSK